MSAKEISLIEEITKLTEERYQIIGSQHHKERDCHFYVETKWSYGYPPKFFVSHDGYILRDVYEEFDTYEEALQGLKKVLEESIEEEKKYGEEDENEW